MFQLNQYKSLSHTKYLIQYHIVWCPKFRYNVIKEDIETRLKTIIQTICKQYDFECIEIETMSDHIHVFIGAKPTIAPTRIVQILKSISAIELFKTYPVLKKFYRRSGHLWSKGYFISTIGNVRAEAVKRYIKNQKSEVNF